MKLYAISDYHLTPYDRIEAMLKEAIYGGIKMFQLRDKFSRDEDILDICANLSEICTQNKVDFIINDRANLALELQKREIPCGLHLGIEDEDIPFTKLRKDFKGKIGVSCYGDINRAIVYQSQGADYVAFGSIFKSATKKTSAVVGCEILREARKRLKIPICAIGGINAQNISQIRDADIVAMVGAVWNGDVGENVRLLIEATNKSRSGGV